VVLTSTHEPISYLVQSENGSMLHKNRKHLQPVPEPLSSISEHVTSEDESSPYEYNQPVKPNNQVCL